MICHGGRRPGAGRPRRLVGGRNVNVYLDAETLAKVDLVSQNLGLTRSQAIRLLIVAANIDQQQRKGET